MKPFCTVGRPGIDIARGRIGAMIWLGLEKMLYMVLLVVLLGLLTACGTEEGTPTAAPAAPAEPTHTAQPKPAGPIEKTVCLGPTLVDCVGVAPQKCMLVKENPGDPYTLFYDRIESFEYQQGFEYELRVKQEEIENPPADASSIRWTLVDEENATRSLEGNLWSLAAYAGEAGDTISVIRGTEVTVEFSAGQVNGNAGCNGYFGSYEVEGNSLTFGMIGSTEMFCAAPEGVMDQETAYLSALQNISSYQVAGDQLEMLDAARNVILTYSILEPESLTGTLWLLTGYNNGRGGFTSVLRGTQITTIFSDDGKLNGSAGCNTYNATYEVDGTQIAIGPAATTRMMCAEPEGVKQQESEYLAELESAAACEIRSDVLTLSNPRARGWRRTHRRQVPSPRVQWSCWPT